MSLLPAHLETLASFGYTPQEAHFLYLVATHSGYFRARQFLGFTRAHRGKRITQFWAKLRARRHGRTERFPTYGLVYHVFAQKLYRHLGRENFRNCGEHEVEYVERRIDMFDFILAHLDYDYLETEPEKRAYFEQTCGVPSHLLPSRTYHGQTGAQPTVRYFVDRSPMFVSTRSSSPVVSFSYIQPAEANLTGLARHLADYLPVFRALPAFRFLYLARSASHFDKARELFNSIITIPLSSNLVEDLLRYFSIRKAWDLRQYAALSEADLIFRNRAKVRFVAERFEHLYRGWKAGKTTEDQIREEFPPEGKRHQVEFEAEILRAAGSDGVDAEEETLRNQELEPTHRSKTSHGKIANSGVPSRS